MIKRLLTTLFLSLVWCTNSSADELSAQPVAINLPHVIIKEDTSFDMLPTSVDTTLIDDIPRQPMMMWRIEKNGRVAHVVGSMHMAPDDIYPLPAEMTNAFMQADTAVFEVDPKTLNQEFQERLGKAGLLPKGTKLSDLLDEETLAKVHAALKVVYAPRNALEENKPWMAALILTFSYTMRQSNALSINNGIDKYFMKLAKQSRKPTRGLETVDDQLELFTSLDNEVGIEFLKKTLDELDDLESIITKMIAAWKQGDTDALWHIVKDSFEEHPDVYEKWTTKRNAAWTETIEQIFESPKRTFIVVGAAHLSGPDSLLEMLKARGCKIEQISSTPLSVAP